MGRLLAAVYDVFTRETEEACLSRWRAELLREVSGDVLEVGAGTGLNVPWYSRAVRRLVLSEPDEFMRRHIVERLHAHADLNAQVIGAAADDLPLRSESLDYVVATLVLCSVPDEARALTEIRRVLKPGGRFVFIEHVAAEDRPRRLKWQRRLEPVWKRVAGNCHLTRHTEAAITDAGFDIERIERESMRKAVPIVRPTIRGVALPSGRQR